MRRGGYNNKYYKNKGYNNYYKNNSNYYKPHQDAPKYSFKARTSTSNVYVVIYVLINI